jgi:ribosome-associated toxin RatA of RatAB toxin-antitoxin module
VRQVQLRARVPDRDADELYALVKRFERYPELTEHVLVVEVTPSGDGRIRSRWEVQVGDGLLRWVEEDVFDDEQRRIRFEQVEGDLQSFTGDWAVLQEGPDAVVELDAEFDLGMASLSSLVEPIAERILRESFALMLSGLTDGTSRLVGADGEPVS